MADAPKWLNRDEMNAWRSLMTLLIELPAAVDVQLQRDAGISHFEYQVLAVLSESPKRTARMSEVAKLTDGSLSRLSHVAARLEQRGWLQRTPDPEDGRFTLATLTKEGWKKVVATAPGHAKEVRRLVIDSLTPRQQQQMFKSNEQILQTIRRLHE